MELQQGLDDCHSRVGVPRQQLVPASQNCQSNLRQLHALFSCETLVREDEGGQELTPSEHTRLLETLLEHLSAALSSRCMRVMTQAASGAHKTRRKPCNHHSHSSQHQLQASIRSISNEACRASPGCPQQQ